MSDANGNDNCLRGSQCPGCGQFKTFRIGVSTVVTMEDDGSSEPETGDLEYEAGAFAGCPVCNWTGEVSELQEAYIKQHGELEES